MTPKERVRRALTFSVPDRVPRDLWVLQAAVWRYRRELDGILTDYPLDLRHDWNDPVEDRSGEPGQSAPATSTDDWGVTWTHLGTGYAGEVKEALVGDWADLAKVVPPFERIEEKAQRANRRCAGTEAFTVAWSGSLFETMQWLRRTDNLLMDIALKETGFYRLLGTVHDYNRELVKRMSATSADALYVSDDWGSQTSLLIAPEDWVRIFKPLYREYARMAHDAGKFFFFHSDGCILSIYDHLIDVGVDAVNSQLSAMDVEAISRNYRGRVTFWGEIDRQHVLIQDDPGEARKAVRKLKRLLYDERGGIIAQCEFGLGATPQSIAAVYEEWNR